MSEEKWCFGVYIAGTTDGSIHGPYDTRGEAEAEAREECERHHTLCPVGYEIGHMVRYSPFLEANTIFDSLYEDAEDRLGLYEYSGELGPHDEYVFDQIYAKRYDLAEYVSRAIRTWMDDNGIATDMLVMERDPEFVEVS